MSLDGSDIYVAENFGGGENQTKRDNLVKMFTEVFDNAKLILTPNEDLEIKLNMTFDTTKFSGEVAKIVYMHTTKGEQDFLLTYAKFHKVTAKLTNVSWASAGPEIR